MSPKKLTIYGVLGCLFIGVLGVIGLAGLLYYHSKDLPELNSLTNYEPRLVTTIYSRTDKVLAEYSTEKRIELETDEIPEVVKKAFIAAEDDEFYEHQGVNFFTIFRAAVKNLLAGKTVQGGSTITQQVAKTFFLSPERTYTRKIKEMLLAFRIEKALSKDEILSRYLNQIFLGHRSYGIESAAQTYFGKSSKELSIPEAAILAGLPKAPSRDNPISNPKISKQRQRYVLKRMLSTEMITESEYQEYLDSPVEIKNKQIEEKWPAPYFAEFVRRYIKEKYGDESLYEGGLKVYTTLDIKAQKAGQEAVNKGLQNVDKRLGLRAPEEQYATSELREKFFIEQHQKLIAERYDFRILSSEGELEDPADKDELTPLEASKLYKAIYTGHDAPKDRLLVQVGNRKGYIEKTDWMWVTQANPTEVYKNKIIRNPPKELKIGDIITVKAKNLTATRSKFTLEQKALVQGALISYKIPEGSIHSMVGGYDFYKTRSEFNRATQAKRQPGSTFKPVVYGAAIEAGLTPSTIIVDSPIVYRNQNEKNKIKEFWKPDNFGSRSYGDTTLRNALAFSRNIPTIKLMQHIGIQKVIKYAQKLGITEELNADLSLGLGSSSLKLDSFLKSWGIFANQGRKLQTYFIRRIEDREGSILEEHEAPSNEQIISAQNAFIITSLLKSVVDYGTATNVQELGRPVAGKTGTTSDSKDALFLGYVPQMITGVWVGFDESHPVGPYETGGKAAAPIWLDYMKQALRNIEKRDFKVPKGIIQVAIDSETGDIPTPNTLKQTYEYFVDGLAPGQRNSKLSTTQNVVINKPQVVTGNPNFKGLIDENNSDEASDELLRNEF